MRSLSDAREAWLILKTFRTFRELKDAVRPGPDGSVAVNGLRSACWMIFLLFDDLDTTLWQKTLTSSRSAYDSLRSHFLRFIENPDEVNLGFDPLSQESEASPWSQLGKDEELRAEIMKDVQRCMPEVNYFRTPQTQQMMLDILFIFCKLNPDIGYKQGMHELLAHVLWVVQNDAIDLGQASRALGEDAIINFMFDANHIEHDAFAIFGQVMQSSKSFYVSEGPESIATRSHHIFNELLPQYDPALAEHLTNLDVVPQIYLIRWIRLLFSREFEMGDALAFWDVLFAEDQTLELSNYIAIAMLLRVRWQLLDGDYNTVLSVLLKYPAQGPEFPPQTFVLDALYLQTHRDTQGASVLVLRYTGRPLLPPGRPATPPALQRNITSSVFNLPRSPRMSFSPPRAARQTRNIEAILQNTAKNIEKLGIGKAVRNAVDEVHRKAQEIRDIQTPATPPWRRPSGLRTNDKLREIEERNRQLSALLAVAVGEMWECQKVIGESVAVIKEDTAAVTDSVDKLGAAIAKVQFVQVYLDDPALVLPPEDTVDLDADTSADTDIGLSQTADAREHDQSKEKTAEEIEDPFMHRAPIPPASYPPTAPKPLADPSSFEDALATPLGEAPPAISRISSETGLPSPADSTILPSRTLASATGAHIKQTESKRPPLEQSAYSFILGQDGDDESRGGPSGSTRSSSLGQGRANVALFGGAPIRGKSPRATADPDGFVGGDKDDFDIGSLRRAKGPK